MTATTATSVNDLERLKVLHNGEKQQLTFSDAEFERRLSGLRRIMAEKNLDAVILTSYQGIKYYSDFLFTYFGRSYGMVVTADDTCTITANIDAGMPWRTSYGENIVYTDWNRDNFYYALQQALAQRGITDPGRLGIEDDTVSLQILRRLQDAFPGAELVDVSQDAMRQRMIKSAEEIAVIKESARIGDIGGEAIKNAVHAGVQEFEVALAGTEAMTREIAKTFPHREVRDTWVWFQSGINTDGAHNWPTTRKLQKGDLLSINCFPMMSGHYTAMERTMFLGQPDKRSLELWKINVEAFELGKELIKPGAIAQDVAAELNRFFEKHDLLKYAPIGYGHSFGVMSPYYGREAAMEFREDIATELKPNMVVSMEPMLTIPDNMPGAGAYREHDILVLTEDGHRNLTGFEVGPEHNIID